VLQPVGFGASQSCLKNPQAATTNMKNLPAQPQPATSNIKNSPHNHNQTNPKPQPKPKKQPEKKRAQIKQTNNDQKEKPN
jgi:hypothetical protein